MRPMRPMRPSPPDVRAWFAAPCCPAATLAARLAALRADPNWRVAAAPGAAWLTLTLTYHPTGETLTLVALPDGPTCHLRLQPLPDPGLGLGQAG